MGLNDPYYNKPWTPQSEVNAQFNQGLSSLGQVGQVNAGIANTQAATRSRELANAEAEYYQPGRQATGPEQGLGDFIRGMMQDGPPEFQERFQQELNQGPSLGAPMAAREATHQGGLASARPAPAPAPAPQARPAPQMPPSPAGFATQMPQTTGQDRDSFFADMTNMPRPEGDMTGMQRPAQAPRQATPPQQTQAQARPQVPASRGPMTRGDVETYLKAAPFLRMNKPDPRAGIAADKLEWEKSKYQQYLKPHWDQMEKTKRDIAALAAKTRMATSDTERKANLELLKIKVQEMRIHSDMLKAQVGGLRGITQEGATNEMVNGAQTDLAEAEAELNALEKAVGSGPVQPTTRTRTTNRETSTNRGPGATLTWKNKRDGRTLQATQAEHDASKTKDDWELQ